MRRLRRNVGRTVVVFALFGLAAGCAAPAGESAAAYTEVEWPIPATTAADSPTVWNFGQVVAIATGADGNILMLQRQRHPILEFAPDGTFVRAWGDGLFSHGKVAGVPPENRASGASGYSAVYGRGGVPALRSPRDPRRPGRERLGSRRAGARHPQAESVRRAADATGDAGRLG